MQMVSGNSPRRIGVLVPRGNFVHEAEFERLCPTNVAFRFGDFIYPPYGSTNFCDALLTQLTEPIRELQVCRCDLILLGCTTASMLCADDEHHVRLEALAGVPVMTSARAASAAARALGLGALAVGTPYGDTNNKIISNYLESQGLSVTAMKGLNLDQTPASLAAAAATLTADKVLELALDADTPCSPGVYLPCTAVASLEAIERFEQCTGKPAFSSVQAGFWASLMRLGLEGRQKGCGKLLESWPS